jgi:hypothetical protein
MATNGLYGTSIANAYGGTGAGTAPNIDYLSDTLFVALVTSAYTPDVDAHDFWNDIVANELANGNGYVTNGAALGSPTVTVVGASNRVDFDGADPSWTFAASKTFRYAVLVDRTPATDATRPVICVIDFGADQTLSTAFSIQFSTSPSAIYSITY